VLGAGIPTIVILTSPRPGHSLRTAETLISITPCTEFLALSRHSYITHLVEFDYPERFVSEQAGHRYASTTAIYTNSRELHLTGELCPV
jgi:site-specific recombinase XerD